MDVTTEVEKMQRGETTKQSLWDLGVPYWTIEAIAAMAGGMPEVFARMIALGYSRETVEKRVAAVFNKP